MALSRRRVPKVLALVVGLSGIAGGADLVEGGREAGIDWVAGYIANRYHNQNDAWDPDWDLRGAKQDVSLILDLTRDLANSTEWPKLKDTSEFKDVREESAAARH